MEDLLSERSNLFNVPAKNESHVLRLEAFSLSGFFFFLHLSICLSKLGDPIWDEILCNIRLYTHRLLVLYSLWFRKPPIFIKKS